MNTGSVPPPGTRPLVSITEARDLILAAPAPVLFGDTCGLLDPARAPLRPKSGGLQPAVELAQRLGQAPALLHVVIPCKVAEEWAEHFERTRGEVRRHIDDTRSAVQALRRACEALGLPPPDDLSASVDLLPDSLAAIAARLFDHAIILAPDEQCRSRAVHRTVLGEAPAKPGKTADDCVIVEHCLGLARALATAGFTLPRVFVSSNTNDYCKAGQLHPALTDVFAGAGLQFATNIAAAGRKLFP